MKSSDKKLADKFACAAMPAIIERAMIHARDHALNNGLGPCAEFGISGKEWDIVAKASYSVAIAMLNARKRLLVLALASLCLNATAAMPEAQVESIVAAIKRVENSQKYPYGIKSINTNGDEAKAKRICRNTVVNNYARWEKAGKPGCYLDFFADKYCPKSCDPQGNKNWKKNIHSILKITH